MIIDKLIEIDGYWIKIDADIETTDLGAHIGGGTVSSNLASDVKNDSEEEEDKNWFNMVNAIESVVLAHACSGIDITSEAYIEGLKTAIDVCANNC